MPFLTDFKMFEENVQICIGIFGKIQKKNSKSVGGFFIFLVTSFRFLIFTEYKPVLKNVS